MKKFILSHFKTKEQIAMFEHLLFTFQMYNEAKSAPAKTFRNGQAQGIALCLSIISDLSYQSIINLADMYRDYVENKEKEEPEHEFKSC